MKEHFDRALTAVLKHEGGWSDHKADPGGATNLGITIGTYRRYINRNGTKDDLKRLTVAQAAVCYRRHYWDKVKADDLPAGIDYAVFDFAVNSGPGRAAKYLQAVLGVKQDGVIGPVTIAAARSAPAVRTIHSLCDRRLAFLRALKTWEDFGRGWQSRVLGVRNDALHMAEQALAAARNAPAEPKAPQPAPASPEPSSGKAGGIAGFIIFAVIALGGLMTGLWQWLSSLF
jgi:lysozyme family protein